MPHQEYLRRLIDDETKCSPASSEERGDASPGDFKRRHTHLGARALAALAQDESEASSEEGDQPSGDTPRAMSAPLFIARDPTPHVGQGEMAGTLQKLRNAKALGIGLGGSPAVSVASRYSSTASRSSDRPPSNNVASAHHAGRTTMDGVASSRNNSAGLSSRGMMLPGPAHNIGLNRHIYNIDLATKKDMSDNPCMKGTPESAKNNQQNTWGITPISRNGVVDLTIDSSDEDEIQLITQTSKKHKAQTPDNAEKNHHGKNHMPNQQTENVKNKSNHPPLKQECHVQAMTDQLIDLIPNDFGGARQAMLTANNKNNSQTVNLPINTDNNKEKRIASRSLNGTVGPKKISAAGTLLCSLTGSLSRTTRGGNRYHSIRGYWEYENHNQFGAECKSFQALGLNRFELCRQITSDIETPPLTEGGIFNGSFAYSWAQKGEPEESFIIHESDVNISFSKRDEESQSFALTGTGRNRLGKFQLVGTACKRVMGDSYDLQCLKEYTELFEAQPSPDDNRTEYTTLLSSNPDDSVHKSTVDRKKMRLSSTEKILKSVGSGGCRGISGIILPPPDIRAVVDSTALFVSKNGRAFGSTILNSEEGRMPKFAFLLDTSPFHAYYEDRIRFYDEEEKLIKQNEREEAERRATNEASMAPAISTSLDDSIASHMSDDVDLPDDAAERNEEVDQTINYIGAHAAQRSWQEFGDFQCMHPMATEDTVEKSHTNDELEACYDIEGKSDKDQVRRDQRDTQHEHVLLETILGSHWASVINSHCGLKTARELYDANWEELSKHLIEVVGADFQGRPEKDVELLSQGLLYGWYIQVGEALNANKSISENTLAKPQRKAEVDSVQSSPPGSCTAFLTPLSYAELKFIKSQNIKTDVELSEIDPSLLAHRYAAYLDKTDKQISLTHASEVTRKWRQQARLALSMIPSDICVSLPQITRLEKNSCHKAIMHTVPSLCTTVSDQENGGLPRRTIFTHDTINNVLYEFLITIGDSTCTAEAGKGAFLTFRGAKVLKASSKWKKRGHIPQGKTRKPLEASFSNTCGAIVTLKGTDLHGDEQHYGPELDNSVGLYREFMLDDFEDTHDNITFSSNHEGCALIELENRYAPLIPADRKTDLVFSVKDFIFSHEPSSWRYDVTEKFRGQPQVVDFTDDTTGAPHDIAKSHVSMYVNEVGHNSNLVENVESLSQTPRSVTYYIHINKPLVKGETLELLTNYKASQMILWVIRSLYDVLASEFANQSNVIQEQYESMRERKGYGKSNLFDGAKSDSDDVSRLRRNLEDRFLLDASILTFSEDDISQVVDFFKEKVWCGIEAATSALKANCKEDDSNLLRQCVARRRLDWLCRRLRIRFLDLLEDQDLITPDSRCSGEVVVFQEGMYIFVHDWPNKSPRPAYTGLATIMSITKDKHNRDVFEVLTPDKKYIEAVPEAVVTHPTDDDFKGAPLRVYTNWKKWKKQQELPRERLRMLKVLDTFNWDPLFLTETIASSAGTSSGIRAKVVDSLIWDFAEEMLFLLAKDKRLTHPFDEMMWCPLSISLLAKCVYLIADFLLMRRDKQMLCTMLTELACDAANSLKEIIKNSANTSQDVDIGNLNKHICVGNLAFKHKVNSRVLVVESVHINKLCVDEYLSPAVAPLPLDFDWYLINQITLPVHAVASLVDWDGKYSLEKLFERIELDIDASYVKFFTQKVQGWRPIVEIM